jgi:hypothetical protein
VARREIPALLLSLTAAACGSTSSASPADADAGVDATLAPSDAASPDAPVKPVDAQIDDAGVDAPPPVDAADAAPPTCPGTLTPGGACVFYTGVVADGLAVTSQALYWWTYGAGAAGGAYAASKTGTGGAPSATHVLSSPSTASLSFFHGATVHLFWLDTSTGALDTCAFQDAVAPGPCTPAPIATGFDAGDVAAAAPDDLGVYYGDPSGDIATVADDGGAPAVVFPGPYAVAHGSLVAVGHDLYFVDSAGGAFLHGFTGPDAGVLQIGSTPGGTVTTDQAFVYFGDGPAGSITRCSIGSNCEDGTGLVPRNDAGHVVSAVAPVGGFVYWVDGLTVRGLPRDGGVPPTDMLTLDSPDAGTFTITSIAADSTWVYVATKLHPQTGADSGEILTVPVL